SATPHDRKTGAPYPLTIEPLKRRLVVRHDSPPTFEPLKRRLVVRHDSPPTFEPLKRRLVVRHDSPPTFEPLKRRLVVRHDSPPTTWLGNGRMVRMPAARRTIRAWMMYDFANSAFAAIVQATVFPAYYANVVVGNADGRGDFWWGTLVSLSMILVALTSPLL